MDTNSDSPITPSTNTNEPSPIQTSVTPTNKQTTEPIAPPTVPPSSPAQLPKKEKYIGMPFIIIILIGAFIGGLLLSAWYFQSQFKRMQTQKPSLVVHTTSAPTSLVIGTDSTFPPMEFVNKQGGLVGFDIDFGYRIANELGMKAEFKTIKWDDIFTTLENKKIDIIISSVSITDERKQKYLFSEPYLNAGQVIIAQRTNTAISSAADIKGKKIGVQKGTTDETEALKLTTANLVIRYDDYEKATKALVAGEVDAILSDLTSAKGIVTDNPSLKISSDPLTNEYYGVVLRKGESDLQKRINDVITSLETKGVLTDLKQKWLN